MQSKERHYESAEIPSENYYDILGVSPDATNETIKKAFRALSKKHHPDFGGDTKIYQRITEAYATLKNPTARKKYDKENMFSYRSQEKDRSAYENRAKTPESYEEEMETLKQELRMREKELKDLEDMLQKKYGTKDQKEANRNDDIQRKERRAAHDAEGRNARIKKRVAFYYLVDKNGNEISSGYERIHTRDGFLIGKSYFEYLLDPETGKELSRGYDAIIVRDGLLIGKSVFEYLLDSKTGKEISRGYDAIEKRGGRIIGKNRFTEEVIR